MGEVKVFVVDDYCDRVSAKGPKAMARELKWRASWKHAPVAQFATESEAWNFIVKRAEAKVVSAKKEVSRAVRQLAKVQARAKQIGGFYD